MCTCIWAFLSIKKKFIPIQFSLHFREKAFWWSQRKHMGPTIYFPSFPPNQTHSKKVFFPIFPSKIFIHSVSPPSKHTLKVVILLFFLGTLGLLFLGMRICQLSMEFLLFQQLSISKKRYYFLTSGEARISLRGGRGERERERLKDNFDNHLKLYIHYFNCFQNICRIQPFSSLFYKWFKFGFIVESQSLNHLSSWHIIDISLYLPLPISICHLDL